MNEDRCGEFYVVSMGFRCSESWICCTSSNARYKSASSTTNRLILFLWKCLTIVGGVFHIVFFKDMEIIWSSQPSMLLARQALMLHLQNNTSFTVVTSIDNYWGKQWKDYVEDKFPAFLLLTDVENIPWKIKPDKQEAVKFFFRSLLCHALGQGLNCVFISGIEMTATKVVGFYTQSISIHKFFFRKVSPTIIQKQLEIVVKSKITSVVSSNCLEHHIESQLLLIIHTANHPGENLTRA